MHSVPLAINEPDKQTPRWEQGRAIQQSLCSDKLVFSLPHGFMLYSPRTYRRVGIPRWGGGEGWHCCKNSLELIRQSMHIFTNIFSRGGEKCII